MNGSETDYLDKLFASSSDVTDEAEVAFPLVDAPENLGEKLYAITESKPISSSSIERRFTHSWPKVTSIAASILAVIMGFQFYQQQQTLKQLEQAQADLATALHYVAEANRITRAQVLSTLNTNMKNGVEPAIEVGRETIIPSLRKPEHENRKANRTL